MLEKHEKERNPARSCTPGPQSKGNTFSVTHSTCIAVLYDTTCLYIHVAICKQYILDSV